MRATESENEAAETPKPTDGRTFKTDRPEIYRRLLKEEHPNIIGVRRVDETEDGGFLVTEEAFEGRTLRECRRKDMDEKDFIYYMMQLCDALDFLSGLDPPIAHGGITADCILIDADDALKLTNFNRARNEESRDGDIAAVGKLIKSMGRFYANRYGSVIEKCEGEYDSFGDIYKDIEGRNHSFLIRKTGLLAAVVMSLFLLARILPRIFRGFLG
jgi:serine/threonine protein kinase